MELSEISRELRNLEKDVLTLVSTPPCGSGDFLVDYSCLEEYLSLAKEIGIVRAHCDVISRKFKKDDGAEQEETPYTTADSEDNRAVDCHGEESSYPLFFINDERLYKVALRRNQDGLYKKNVPVDELALILQEIDARVSDGSEITSANLAQVLPDIADYKKQVTLSALEYCGILKQNSRGRFSVADGVPSNENWTGWMRVLERQPKRPDLLG